MSYAVLVAGNTNNEYARPALEKQIRVQNRYFIKVVLYQTNYFVFLHFRPQTFIF